MRKYLRSKISSNQNDEERKTSAIHNIFNNGLLIALIPGYAYLLAFAYEYGYCKHFELPLFLISPSLASILIIISVFVLFVFSNLKFLGIVTPLFKILRDPKYSSYYPFLRLNTLFLIATLIVFFIYRFYWGILLPILIVWVLYDVIYFAPVWFFDKKKKSLQERFDAYNSEEDKLDLLVYISSFVDRRVINYSLLAALIVGMSFLLGNGKAYNQERFYVLQSDSTQVLLRTYNEILICSKVDYKTHTVSRDYTLLNLKTFYELEFKQIKIGKLSIIEDIQEKKDNTTIAQPDSLLNLEDSDTSETMPNELF
jgi:hypothetical protein